MTSALETGSKYSFVPAKSWHYNAGPPTKDDDNKMSLQLS